MILIFITEILKKLNSFFICIEMKKLVTQFVKLKENDANLKKIVFKINNSMILKDV